MLVNKTLRRHLLQQRLRLFKIASVQAFREPPVNWSKRFARLLHLALVAPGSVWREMFLKAWPLAARAQRPIRCGASAG